MNIQQKETNPTREAKNVFRKRQRAFLFTFSKCVSSYFWYVHVLVCLVCMYSYVSKPPAKDCDKAFMVIKYYSIPVIYFFF